MTTTTGAPNTRVKDALDGIDAKITRDDTADGIDFDLDGISGFARDRRGKFRASYFIAVDPDPQEAEQWVAEHDDIPDGEVQIIEAGDSTTIRLLVELPFDEHHQIWTTAQTARALHAGWLNRNEGDADLIATLGAAGIALPPLGPIPRSAVHTYGAWSWGSRYIPPYDLYRFDVELVARHLVEHGPFFALAHSGHGTNSYGLNLVTTSGPVAAYVQHGYGGAYSNPVSDLIDINATYSRLHVLLRAAQETPATEVRWLLVFSFFGRPIGIVDLDKIREGSTFDDAIDSFDSESTLFEAAAQLPPFEGQHFGTGISVSW